MWNDRTKQKQRVGGGGWEWKKEAANVAFSNHPFPFLPPSHTTTAVCELVWFGRAMHKAIAVCLSYSRCASKINSRRTKQNSNEFCLKCKITIYRAFKNTKFRFLNETIKFVAKQCFVDILWRFMAVVCGFLQTFELCLVKATVLTICCVVTIKFEQNKCLLNFLEGRKFNG